MEATYRAISSAGYADLTMSAIADEFEKSQSLIHYHYDTKEDLLAAFLSYLIEQFVGKVESGEVEPAASGTPRETLDAVVDALLVGPEGRDDFPIAMLELRAQAPHSEAYRDQFVENDDHLRELLAGLVEACVDAGALPDVDAGELAHRVLVAIEGARTRRIVLGDDEELGVGRAMVDDLLDAPPDGLLDPPRRDPDDPSPGADG